MKGDLLDKVLILLMIVMLPISIFFASRYQSEEGSKNTEVDSANTQKIDQLLNEIKVASTDESPKIPPITIASVAYATESGELKITGSAPGRNLNVMVSATVLPRTKLINTSDPTPAATTSAQKPDVDESVLGEAVEVVAVKVNNDGQFTYLKKLNTQKDGIVELRFDQAESTATVQYDLVSNRRTL